MHFTREPIVESVITPSEGFKLVIRNSKASGVEEYFVDAVEVVRFGDALFFRSLERPKSFLLPVSDYEALEVRETRMVLKHAAAQQEKAPSKATKKAEEPSEEPKRRKTRRRRTRKEEAAAPEEEQAPQEETSQPEEVKEVSPPKPPTPMLPPPTSLISENIGRYKDLIEKEEPETAPEAPEESLVGEERPSFSASRFIKRLTGREDEE